MNRSLKMKPRIHKSTCYPNTWACYGAGIYEWGNTPEDAWCKWYKTYKLPIYQMGTPCRYSWPTRNPVDTLVLRDGSRVDLPRPAGIV